MGGSLRIKRPWKSKHEAVSSRESNEKETKKPSTKVIVSEGERASQPYDGSKGNRRGTKAKPFTIGTHGVPWRGHVLKKTGESPFNSVRKCKEKGEWVGGGVGMRRARNKKLQRETS